MTDQELFNELFSEPGTYVDEWWGQYAPDRAFLLALSEGMPMPRWWAAPGWESEWKVFTSAARDRVENLHKATEYLKIGLDDYFDTLHGIQDAVEAFLNTRTAPGFMFLWWEGSLMLLPECDADEYYPSTGENEEECATHREWF